MMERVYPRVHGGTRLCRGDVAFRHGLSPRARGNPALPCMDWSRSRSIPACTGEPWRWPLGTRRPSVYPRVHGGTADGYSGRTGETGLSPRARGNQPRRYRHDAGSGSIPACTGEPAWLVVVGSIRPVYPRVHGGTQRWRLVVVRWAGLSPRARGNPIHSPGSPTVSRSIPACTGEPDGGLFVLDVGTLYPRVHGGTGA